jgi:hypothetical protein
LYDDGVSIVASASDIDPCNGPDIVSVDSSILGSDLSLSNSIVLEEVLDVNLNNGVAVGGVINDGNERCCVVQ